MPFFSRLTDIVTCNLTSMLAEAADPAATLSDIIREMEQGIAGAHRCMKTAFDNENRLRSEIDEQRRQSDYWVAQARKHLGQDEEDQARLDLLRKHEVENLLAGLEIQLKAAAATREHLTTTYHALEARLADARRRLAAMGAPSEDDAETAEAPEVARSVSRPPRATDVIDIELAALKQELSQAGRSGR
jgi:phage shock protein A